MVSHTISGEWVVFNGMSAGDGCDFFDHTSGRHQHIILSYKTQLSQ